MAEEKIVKRIKLVKSKQQTELLQFITKQNSKLVSAKHKQNQLELTLETMGKKMILKSRKAVSNLGYYVGVLSKDTITIGNTRVYQLQPDLQFMEEELNHQQEAKAIHLTTQHDIGKSTLLQKSEKEPWVGLNVHLKNSGKSAEMRHSFVSGISSSSSIVKREVDNAVADDDSLDAIDDKDFTPKDYLSKISNSISSFKPFSPLMSLSESKNMNLHDRLLALMLNCHAISHSDLKELFKDFKSDKEILEGIVVIAVNIKGIWIIKSEYLYTSRPKQARDILLLTLLNNGFLDRAQWTNSTGIDATMSLNMVGEICVLEDRKWRLKVVEDGSALFAKRYHSVVENSAEFIKIEGNKALEAINSTKKPATTSTAKSKVSVKPVVQVTDSIIKLEGEEFGSQFINLVKSIFRQSGSVLSRELVVKFLNLQKIQKECLFKDKDTASLNAELDKHTITLRPDLLILQEAPDLSLVNFRNVLIKLFDNVEKIKKKEVMEKWLEECGCVPNSGQYTKLMQEFAVTKSGGIWILKGLKD